MFQPIRPINIIWEITIYKARSHLPGTNNGDSLQHGTDSCSDYAGISSVIYYTRMYSMWYFFQLVRWNVPQLHTEVVFIAQYINAHLYVKSVGMYIRVMCAG